MTGKRTNRKRPRLEELMEARPVVNHAAEVLVDEPDRLVLSVPVRKRWWNTGIMYWLIPTRRTRRFELDGRGRFFLALCDGDRTVAEIVRRFSAEYHLSPLEARIAVAAFIELLLQKGLIVLVGPPPDHEDADAT